MKLSMELYTHSEKFGDFRAVEMLKEAGVTYHLIGDGCKVGNIKDAISQGYTVAKDL